MPGEENTPALIADARQGNEHARSQLVVRASRIARRVALARTGVDVEEVVQNTALRVMESLASLRDTQAFDGWVAAVANNEARMLMRRRTRWRQLQLALRMQDPNPLGATGGPVPEGQSGRSPRVRAALARLPPNHRDLLLGRYMRGESHRAISARLGISTSAVKSRLHRARKRLKEELFQMNPNTPIRLNERDVESLAVTGRFRATGEDSRPAVRGILLERRGYAVACDGARLLMRRIPALTALDDDVLVEPNGAEALAGRAELSVRLDEVRIALGTEELAWGISQRRYPDYTRVLPDHRDVLMRVRVRADDLRSAIGPTPGSAEGSDRDRADYVRLSLLPGGTLVAGVLVDDAEPDRARAVNSTPIELLEVEVAKELADQFVDMRLLREAVFALDGPEISVSAGLSLIDMTDGEHRILTMCVETADSLTA